MRKATVVLAVLFVAASVGFADDLNPPTWRGADFTTVQEWDFTVGDPTPDLNQDFLPDGLYFNPYGGAIATTIPARVSTGTTCWTAVRACCCCRA